MPTATAKLPPRGAPPAPAPPTREGWLAAGLALLLVLLLAVAAVLIVLDQQASSRAERDQAVTVAARDEVLALLNINPGNAQQSFDRAITGATGSWKQQLVQSGGALTGAISGAQLNVRASVTESGVSSVDDERAAVLVVAQMFVGNASGPAAAPRPFRARLELERTDQGWLVSSLEGLS